MNIPKVFLIQTHRKFINILEYLPKKVGTYAAMFQRFL